MSRVLLGLVLAASLFGPSLSGWSGAAAFQSDDSEGAESGVEGNSYTSPAFGYSITWDRDWEVTDEQNDAEYNKIVLANAAQSVYFEGVVDSSDLDSCVEQIIQNVTDEDGVSDVEQREDSDGPIGGSEDGRSWAVYNLTFTGSNGDPINFVEYVDCRPIVEGESLLVISSIIPEEQYDDEIVALESLLEGLSLDGSTSPSDGNDTGDDSGDVPAGGDLGEFVIKSGEDIDTFWRAEFPVISDGDEYTPPTDVIPFDDAVDTDCGTANVGEIGPFYCPVDSTVYYDLAFAELQVNEFKSNSVIAVAMAHEVGHHIQNLMGWAECEATPCLDPTQMTSQEFELQADCFAGAWVADAETRGRLGSFDVETNITQFALLLGDEGIGNTADPGAHGKAASRVYWFLSGYFFGVDECLTVSAATDPARNGQGGTSEPDRTPTAEATEEPTDDPTEEPTDEPTEEPTDEPTEESNGNSGGTIAVGDEFDIDIRSSSYKMTVTGSETATDFGGDAKAQGQFLIVYFSIDRTAGNAGPFRYSAFTVKDADGNEYEVDEAATDELLKTADTLPDGVDQDIEEGTTYNLAFVFDVDAEATGFVLADANGDVEVELGD